MSRKFHVARMASKRSFPNIRDVMCFREREREREAKKDFDAFSHSKLIMQLEKRGKYNLNIYSNINLTITSRSCNSSSLMDNVRIIFLSSKWDASIDIIL